MFLAFALRRRYVFFPYRRLRGDFRLQLLLPALILLHHLVERRNRYVNFVEPLQFFSFDGNRGAHRIETIHFLHQLLRDAAQRSRNFYSQL